jgi:hypothetical protein
MRNFFFNFNRSDVHTTLLTHTQRQRHTSTNNLLCYVHNLGHAVAQLVEALRDKPEGSGFDSRWCQ